MKTILKRIIPTDVLIIIKVHIERIKLLLAYLYDLERFLKYSSLCRYDNNKIKLISTIIRNYHVIEKGLTMPETRLGFGKERIIKLINECIHYIENYDRVNIQLDHAIKVILEYIKLHEALNYKLDNNIIVLTNKLLEYKPNLKPGVQKVTTRIEYFKNKNSSFNLFSSSRSSIRNYCSDTVPMNKLIKSIELARNTPSACNRQAPKVYVYENKEKIINILDVQGGNRGFGHLADKLIVITAELGAFISIAERNQAFIDGGMYAMNLLYALHFEEVAGCILNCSTTPKKDKQLRKLCDIKESEVLIAMVSCGVPPIEFKIANSIRYNIEDVCTIHQN